MTTTIKEITKEWLNEENACKDGIAWFCGQKETASILVLEKLITEEKYDYANWLIVRVMEYHDYVSYAVYAAEQVRHIYEDYYPSDNRPRKAIDAAKICINNPSKENKKKAWEAAVAAVAAEAAGAAGAAAMAAARAARAAAGAVVGAAARAAEAAWAAREATKKDIQKKILSYGMALLIGGGK